MVWWYLLIRLLASVSCQTCSHTVSIATNVKKKDRQWEDPCQTGKKSTERSLVTVCLRFFFMYPQLETLVISLITCSMQIYWPCKLAIKWSSIYCWPGYPFACWSLSIYAKKKKNIFHPLEVVSRYRDQQLQVGENLNYLNQQDKG